MIHWLRWLGAVVLLGMIGQSCTCHSDVPPPPVLVEHRPNGFNSALPTKKAGEHKKERLAAATPVTPTAKAETTPTAGNAALPVDFPKDIPVLEGSEPFAVQDLAGNAHNVLFHSDKEAPAIFQHYRQNMQTKGWNVTQEYQNKEQSFLSFKKGKTITNMTIAKDPRTGKQVVAIMYYEEEDLPFKEF
jgi:hypothetical protein